MSMSPDEDTWVKAEPSNSLSPPWKKTLLNAEPADREYFLMTLTCLNCLAAEQEAHICPTAIGEILWMELQVSIFFLRSVSVVALQY